MSSLLQGVAFITGAASGIGRGTAFGFAKHGIRSLAIADVDEAALKSAAAEIEAGHPGTTCLPLVLDVTSEDSVARAIAAVVERFGRIDIAVNNAGVGGPAGPAPSVAFEAWRACFDVNVHGVWLCQRAEIAQMLKQENESKRRGRGVIINNASMLGLVGVSFLPTPTAYSAGKHAVVGMTRTDSLVFAKEGIRINAICPGYVETNLTTKIVNNGLLDPELERTPMGRVAEIDEIVDCMVFLGSNMSSFMTGATLTVDGGYTAR